MNDIKNNPNQNKNLKPFLGAFIILIIILSVYYFFWRSTVIKMKNIIANSLNNYQYKSIEISGFPFSKTITVSDITFDNGLFLASKNQIKIQKIKVSSIIFSGILDVNFKNVTTLDVNNNIVYSLMFNEEPKVNLSFYPNGSLKSFDYTDFGYRVTTVDNKTLYTAGASKIKIESTRNLDTIDYSINGELKDMQNIVVIEKKDQLQQSSIPQIYNMNFEISSSFTKKEDILTNSTIKINNFNLFSNNGNGINITGEIYKDSSDPYSFGNLKLVISNYETMLTSYKNDLISALNTEFQNDSVNPEQKDDYIKIINNSYNVINSLIKKNPDTKDNTGVVDVLREKNTPNYIINSENMTNIIQNIMQ